MEVCRYHPAMQILMYFLTCPPVVLNITLESLNNTDSLPTPVLNDYNTLFEARHGRGAIDNMPKSGEKALATSSIGMPSMTSSMGMTENFMVGARPKHIPDSRHLPPSQRGTCFCKGDSINHRT